MNSTDLLSLHALDEALKSGEILCFYELHALARFQNGVYYVSFPSCTQRLKKEDFFALYGGCRVRCHRVEPGIDDEKDEAYYAWRREKQ